VPGRGVPGEPDVCWSKAERELLPPRPPDEPRPQPGFADAPPPKATPSPALAALLREYTRHWKSCTQQETPSKCGRGCWRGRPWPASTRCGPPRPRAWATTWSAWPPRSSTRCSLGSVLLLDGRSMLTDLFCEPFQVPTPPTSPSLLSVDPLVWGRAGPDSMLSLWGPGSARAGYLSVA